MKAILIISAGLMLGASAIGVIDYNKTAKKEAFKKMYHEDKPVVAIKKPDIRTIEAEDFSRAKLSDLQPEATISHSKKNYRKTKKKTDSVETITVSATADSAIAVVQETNPIRVHPKKRKLDWRQFSRAKLERTPVDSTVVAKDSAISSSGKN